MVGHRRFLPAIGFTIGMVGMLYIASKFFLDNNLIDSYSATESDVPLDFPKRGSASNFATYLRLTEALSQRTAPAEPCSAYLAPPLANLSPDQGSVLAEVVQLQQLAADTTITLTAEQWLALGSVTARFQTLRHLHEASISAVGRLDARSYTLEIPPYPETGATLKASFESSVQAALGSDAAGAALRALSPALIAHFGGFGVSQQTLEFARNSRLHPDDYEVTRTVTFWQGSANEGRAVTRRETFLPGSEDPAGASWGPLLQVLEKSISGG
jgi:hypothetical protein